MDPVDSLSRILALLRKPVEEAGRSRISATAPNKNAAAGAKAGKTREIAELKRTLADRIRSLDRSVPGWEETASQLIVASVLAWEFGDQLLLDDRFTELSAEVYHAMAADPDVRAGLLKVVREMAQ